ncbi:MAG: DoxX family protein [Methylophilaceae bacterium]
MILITQQKGSAKMNGIIQLAGRCMLALIFILAGVGKIQDPAGTAGYMQSMGVPAILLWPTIALEVLGGLAVAVGYKTELASLALAIFSLIAAFIFHKNFGDQMQMIMFLKNIAIAGGLLILAAGTTTAYSLDAKKKNANFFGTRQG